MADAKMKVSQMGAVLAMDDDDLINVVTYNDQSQTYVSGKATGAKVKEYMIGTGDISALGDGSVTGAILNVKSTSETADSNIAETMAQNGAHNLLPFPYYEGGAGVYDGISFTFGSDGSVSASGNLANTSLMYRFFSGTLPKGNYRFRFVGSFSGPGLELKTYDATAGTGLGGTTSSANTDLFFTIDSNNENHTIWLYFNSDNSSNAVSISGMPILALASDTSNVTTPYAMTNGELTEKVAIKVGSINDSAFTGSGLSKRLASIVKTGNVVQFTFDIKKDSGSNPFSLVELIPDGFRPKTNTPVVCSDGSEFGISTFSVTTGGWLNGIYIGTTGYLIGSITYIVD